MVLENLIGPFKAKKKPYVMFFIGFFVCIISSLLAIWVFPSHAGIISLLLTVMVCAPFMYHLIKIEEDEVLKINSEKNVLKEHSHALFVFLFLFIGVVVAYSSLFLTFAPEVANAFFNVQLETVNAINGQFFSNSSSAFFYSLLSNNLKVLVFCILFAFLYGVGALFILTWNASVLAVAIGKFIQTYLKTGYFLTKTSTGLVYIQAAGASVLRYLIHGIPEMFAYMVAGLAGGIISVAVINHDFGTKKYERILLDAADLLILSVIIIFVAAAIEAYITPYFFSARF